MIGKRFPFLISFGLGSMAVGIWIDRFALRANHEPAQAASSPQLSRTEAGPLHERLIGGGVRRAARLSMPRLDHTSDKWSLDRFENAIQAALAEANFSRREEALSRIAQAIQAGDLEDLI